MALLLTEIIMPDQYPLLVENDQTGRFLYLKGLFLQGEVRNQNGRIYPREEIAKAVQTMKQKIKERGPIPGELDHPQGLNINFDRISHVITEIDMNGANGIGTMRVINEGLGKVVRGCADAGMVIGVSTRGTGNLDNDGRVSDFAIVTVDIVANPSAPDAYPHASLGESIMRNAKGREAVRLSESVKHDATAQKFFQKEFENFLISIRDEVQWRK